MCERPRGSALWVTRHCNQKSVLTMSRIEIGPRVLTESSTVTTVGFSVKEAEVAEVKCQIGAGTGEGMVRGENREMGED